MAKQLPRGTSRDATTAPTDVWRATVWELPIGRTEIRAYPLAELRVEARASFFCRQPRAASGLPGNSEAMSNSRETFASSTSISS